MEKNSGPGVSQGGMVTCQIDTCIGEKKFFIFIHSHSYMNIFIHSVMHKISTDALSIVLKQNLILAYFQGSLFLFWQEKSR